MPLTQEHNLVIAGRVFLTGAGPGDPGLLTIKAKEALLTADVILYDGLVSEAVLCLSNPAAQLVDVSKRAGHSSLTQGEINELLIEHAREGKQVVRLKCGDPFVFGRGAEEALALANAGIAWEVIPGVSSGLAASAYAGIPLTHRKLASSVAFVTGQEDPTKDSTKVDWQNLASAVDTIVIFMGLGQLPQIALSLIVAGKPVNTPVAVIESGTYNEQRVMTGTLETISDLVRDFQSPSLIVVGEVVDLSATLNWFQPTLRQFQTESIATSNAVS